MALSGYSSSTLLREGAQRLMGRLSESAALAMDMVLPVRVRPLETPWPVVDLKDSAVIACCPSKPQTPRSKAAHLVPLARRDCTRRQGNLASDLRLLRLCERCV